jgi:hypothetical protein
MPNKTGQTKQVKQTGHKVKTGQAKQVITPVYRH